MVYTQNTRSPSVNYLGPFAFSDKSYIEEILKVSGLQNKKIDTVRTFISTKDTVEKDVEILLNIGPRAKMLTEANLSDEKKLTIKNEIKKLCRKRQKNSEITYEASLHYVSAVK